MGFDVKRFVSKVSEDRKCSLCHLVLDNPVRTPCSHVFCFGCVLPWVVRYRNCPFNCHTLQLWDLDTVVALRELVLNMKVLCDFSDHGCSEILKLRDLARHARACDARPVKCRNTVCQCKVPLKEPEEREARVNELMELNVCENGCGLPLSSENHECMQALCMKVTEQTGIITNLEEDIETIKNKFGFRERFLISKITSLTRDLQQQAMKFRNLLRNYQSLKEQIQMGRNDNSTCENECGEDEGLTVMLERIAGTLGFNVMGGYSVCVWTSPSGAESELVSTVCPDITVQELRIIMSENNNNNNTKDGMVTEGIIVSKVLTGGPADLKGLKTHDQVVKVNGRDLSQATHEEAVEAFRTAKEPIVVEVLRRVNKNKMKTKSPIMVSIGTQTEEDIYGFNRPPTPPSFFPLPFSGLYQQGSRRPVVFSPSTEMGLTDIEMAQLDYDDPYFDDRQYDFEYEEIVLQRPCEEEKLGLTLCYGAVEDGITDIFIGEIDPYSVAAKDGRLREGDQIVQINGVDVHSRDQAIKLFSEKGSDITLIVARPQIQIDDGFMEEHNVVLDALQMDILEKHHHDNMQIMASMLARGHHFDEEGGTTDTATTENSSHKHEKDSGVGRTDESTKNDESSEQEVFDAESVTGTHKSGKKCSQSYCQTGDQQYSNDSFVSTEITDGSYEIPDIDCDKFREVLENHCDINNLNKSSSPRKCSSRNNSESSVDKEMSQLNREVDGVKLQKDNKADVYRSPRNVPRMGTRLEYMKSGGQCSESPDSGSPARRESPTTTKMGQARVGKNIEKDNGSTSAYNTGESCRSTPLMLELNMASDESEKGFKNSMLCLATTSVTTTPPLPSHSDTEKQTQTPARSRECSSEENYKTFTNNRLNITENGHKETENQLNKQINSGESLQDLYMQYADVMYTNRANLEHTMQIQQKLFQQQLEQKHHHRRKSGSPSLKANSQTGNQSGNQSANDSQSPSQQQTGNTPPDSGQMEWVVKRRPDGTRYITRRAVKSKLLKERAKKISEERSGMTTDDDAMSELKTGRYWTKEERKRHMERAKDQKKKREMIARAKMETLKETDEKKEVGIVELSHRKMMKHKGKRALDDFTTVQEMLAHGNKMPEGKQYNPLLSVTTV